MLPLYNLLVSIGVVVGVLIFQRKLDHDDLARYDSISLVLGIAILGALVSAALFDGMVHGGLGGLTYMGGLLGGILLALGLWRILLPKISILPYLNYATLGLVVGHALGRVGCFLAGCCYGRPTDCATGVLFPSGSLADSTYGQVPVHPTQLYEAVFLSILWLILRKMPRVAFPGYLIGYGLFRFINEFLRGDSRGRGFGLLTPSQFMSLVAIIIGGIYIFYQLRVRGYEQSSSQP